MKKQTSLTKIARTDRVNGSTKNKKGRAVKVTSPEARIQKLASNVGMTEVELLELHAQMRKLSLASAEEEQDNQKAWDVYNTQRARGNKKSEKPVNARTAKDEYTRFLAGVNATTRSSLIGLSDEIERQLFASEDAFQAWRMKIAGDFSVNMYVGLSVLMDIQASRPGILLSKEEVELLAMPDGPRIKCDFTELSFQPVKYICYVTAKLAAHLQTKGNSIVTAEKEGLLPYHGCAFQHDKNPENIVLVSGSVFRHDSLSGLYHECHVSHLFRTARVLQNKKGLAHPKWGWTRQEASRELKRAQSNKQGFGAANSFLFGSGSRDRRGVVRVRDAFQA